MKEREKMANTKLVILETELKRKSRIDKREYEIESWFLRFCFLLRIHNCHTGKIIFIFICEEISRV